MLDLGHFGELGGERIRHLEALLERERGAALRERERVCVHPPCLHLLALNAYFPPHEPMCKALALLFNAWIIYYEL